MCGIAGIIGSRTLVEERHLNKLAKALAHRGPDDEGIELVASSEPFTVGFVHRRLAIIDLSPSGHQPMKDPVTGNWIIFNGEIYNYRELRVSLEQRGCTFTSESDTEVILKTYAMYGHACVEKLRGMFAFALWDASRDELFLAVDRFGIKPLYYYKNCDTFLFSSEVQALLASGLVDKVINPAAVDSFLSFGAVQAPLTMIKGVHALLPAHALVYNTTKREIAVRSYWTPSGTMQGSPDDIGAALDDAVRHHLVSDVPVGLFLSGGIDSSALAIAANRVSGGPALDSFSVVFPEREYSEQRYSRYIGERFCARHHEIELSEADLTTLLPAALAAQDQPTIDGINAYVISQAVHETGIKVVLSGQGGDEVFGGYATFKRMERMRFYHHALRMLPPSLRARLAQLISEGSIARAKGGQYLTANDDLLEWYALLRQLFSGGARRRLLGGNYQSSLVSGIPEGAASWLRSEIQGRDTFNAVSLLELRGYLANTLLRDGDVMSMVHGLEVRVPFLDHLLVEKVMSIPPTYKQARSVPKPLLLRAVQGALPKEIYQRKKMGFTFPWEQWLRNTLKVPMDEVFQSMPSDNVFGLDADACRDVWKQFLDRKPSVTWSRVWALYVLLIWEQRI
ncbi:MAG: asparagine synthase (glutamine-hydrolyzing) [bacterium]|nr:asparagine synthase (glutamine-hydrolyzing) [bacterium]